MSERRRALGALAFAIVVAAAPLAGCRKGEAETFGGGDVKVIAHGEQVDLAAHLAAGKHTVFDFYAPWCPPCRVLGPALERLAAAQPDRLAIRKVDIVDWTTPVVDQHGIEALPHLILYDASGRVAAEGDQVYTELERLFGDAAKEVIQAGTGDDTPKPAEGTKAADGTQVL
ncbi:MAG TPA: thioredoxin family protein [Candidatus Polarisedimenticolia bacterium]|nr:thioredoxin family protein [Candidatus Polarisedimenticolia bacterium]